MTTFRRATLSELSQILDWAADESWNPGLDDAAAFYAADPDGFFLAFEDNVPVAAISVVNHSDSFAFLGLYIVRPSYRGRGLGYALWRHAVSHAGARTIGLDGVPEQQANYAASGFRAAGGTTRFSGSIDPPDLPAPRLAQPGDIARLVDDEARASGVRKERYLTAWFFNTANRTTFLDDDGFCTVRRCRQGAKIGPLVAGTAEASLRLVQRAGAAMGPHVTIDVPARANVLTELCRGLGFDAGFETARMYRGDAPPAAHPNFAVTTLELG